MNPHLVASLESAVMAFGAGAWTALLPFFTTGKMPDQTQWGAIISAVVAGGIAGVYLRFRPAPSQGPTTTTLTAAVETAMAKS